MKIGITGVHGAGKTTLANKLRKEYSDSGACVIVVDEVARKCPYTLGTIEAQEHIWRTQMMREKLAMKQDVGIIICDRTVMDTLMYYHAIIEDIIDPDEWWDCFYNWQKHYQEAELWMSTYDQVIRLPLNLEYLKADDPIRPKDVGYARRIDKLFDVFVDPFVTNTGYDEDFHIVKR